MALTTYDDSWMETVDGRLVEAGPSGPGWTDLADPDSTEPDGSTH